MKRFVEGSERMQGMLFPDLSVVRTFGATRGVD